MSRQTYDWGGGTLTREETAQILYSIGFRGDRLIDLVAIAGRESGYRPGIHGSDQPQEAVSGDRGLFQINSVHDDRLMAAGIIRSKEDLFDPVVNARAAFFLSGGGQVAALGQLWGAGEGGWNGAGNYLYGTNREAAELAVQNAQEQGLLGQDWEGSTGTPSPGGNEIPQQGPVDLPSDARVVETERGRFVVFGVDGIWMYYNAPQGSINLGKHEVEKMSHSSFANRFDKAVSLGKASELGELATTFGTFGRFWKSILDQIFGRGNPAREDPGVLRAIAEFAARPDMDPLELENIIKGTGWWRKQTDAERIWNDLSPAEQHKQRQDMMARMTETWFQFQGREMNWNDPFIQKWVDDLASGKVSFSLFTKRVRELAKLNPESPWSRTIRDEDEAQRQRGVDIENTAERVRSEALRWGLRWKEGRVQDWAQGIVEKRLSDQDLMDKLRELAAVRYPGKPPDMDTSTWAENYTQSFDEIMEQTGDVFTPQIQRALKKGLNLHDFETELKNSPEWRSTKNADAAFHATLTKVGEMFGMA